MAIAAPLPLSGEERLAVPSPAPSAGRATCRSVLARVDQRPGAMASPESGCRRRTARRSRSRGLSHKARVGTRATLAADIDTIRISVRHLPDTARKVNASARRAKRHRCFSVHAPRRRPLWQLSSLAARGICTGGSAVLAFGGGGGSGGEAADAGAAAGGRGPAGARCRSVWPEPRQAVLPAGEAGIRDDRLRSDGRIGHAVLTIGASAQRRRA